MRPPAKKHGHYLALDVALRNTGVVVYDCFFKRPVLAACLTTASQVKETGCYVADDNARCVRSLVRQLDFLLLRYPNIKEAFAELPHGGAKSSSAASKMSLAVGGIVAFLYARGITLHNVSPAEVKHLVREKGEVEKIEVQKYAESVFGNFTSHLNKGQTEHVADAAGALLAGLKKYHGHQTQPSR